MTRAKKKPPAKILLIEDDELTIRTITFVLSSEGFHVIVARNGREAVQMLDEGADLILLDLVMPELNGFEVLKIIRREKHLTIPVVVLSNLSSDRDISKAFELGATDYLVKNELSVKTITEKVKTHLRRAFSGR